MLSCEVCHLLTYWHSLGGGSEVPDKAILDLRQLTSILPWMFILEMSDDGALVYRLAGSSLEGAIGRGMAGENYTSVLAQIEHAMFLEELYAVALVQGCGIMRSGSFTLAENKAQNLEVLVLPFNDSRAMGGSIFVGVIRPFDYHNAGFADNWGTLEEQVNRLYVVPSPRILKEEHLSTRVTKSVKGLGIELRALDVRKMVEIDKRGLHKEYDEVPSLNIDSFSSINTAYSN